MKLKELLGTELNAATKIAALCISANQEVKPSELSKLEEWCRNDPFAKAYLPTLEIPGGIKGLLQVIQGDAIALIAASEDEFCYEVMVAGMLEEIAQASSAKANLSTLAQMIANADGALCAREEAMLSAVDSALAGDLKAALQIELAV